MSFDFGITLTVKSPGVGGTDAFGNPIPGSTHTIDDCALAPAGSTEIVNGQATVIDQDTIYGPYDAVVTSQDLIVIPDGQPIPAGDYQVDGRPARYLNPFDNDQAGTVIRLARATG